MSESSYWVGLEPRILNRPHEIGIRRRTTNQINNQNKPSTQKKHIKEYFFVIVIILIFDVVFLSVTYFTSNNCPAVVWIFMIVGFLVNLLLILLFFLGKIYKEDWGQYFIVKSLISFNLLVVLGGFVGLLYKMLFYFLYSE